MNASWYLETSLQKRLRHLTKLVIDQYTTAPQWAMARVNSFITKGKGTWGKADSDEEIKVTRW